MTSAASVVDLNPDYEYSPGDSSRYYGRKSPQSPGTARMTRARSTLLLDNPWFGSLSLRLTMVEDGNFPGLMATDGTIVVFNPEMLKELTDSEVQAVLAHETLHCALLHPFRRGKRSMKTWNKACDHVINLALKKQGFRLPVGKFQGLMDPRFEGMSSEQVYAILLAEQQKGGGEGEGEGKGEGEGGGQGDGSNDLLNPPSPDAPPTSQDGSGGSGNGNPPPGGDQGGRDPQGDKDGAPDTPKGPRPQTETDWSIAAQQATMVAKRAGRLPSDMDLMIKEARRPIVDWRAVLRRFIENTVPHDYSWSTPNRRHISQGLYFPGMTKENTPRLVVAVDTSGSIACDQKLLDTFAAELTSIMLETRPVSMQVIYCDAKVQGEQTFTPDDGDVKLNAKGGGGTAFTPVFEHVAASEDEPPAALIYLTDLESWDIPSEPDYPVLWGTTPGTTKNGPFGETVRIEEGR